MRGMEKRSKNFTSFDKKMLVELVMERKSVIENKRTDSSTNMEKKLAWDELTDMFNEKSQSGKRTAKQLKDLYGFIKRNARKHNFVDKLKTETDEVLISSLRKHFIPDPLDDATTSSTLTVPKGGSEVPECEVVIVDEVEEKIDSPPILKRKRISPKTIPSFDFVKIPEERSDLRENVEDGDTNELKKKILKEEFEQAKLRTLILKAQLERELLEVEKIKNELKK